MLFNRISALVPFISPPFLLSHFFFMFYNPFKALLSIFYLCRMLRQVEILVLKIFKLLLSYFCVNLLSKNLRPMFRYAYISFKRKMQNETGFKKGRKSPSVFLLLNEKMLKKSGRHRFQCPLLLLVLLLLIIFI